MRKNARPIIVCIILITITLILARAIMHKNSVDSISVWTRFQPYSVDPLDYDYDVHHLVMRSVFASLVSIYKEGEVTPQVAKSWHSNSDFSRWDIEINTDWFFSNNEFVSPEIVLKSFKRVAYVKHIENSNSGLLEYLKGFNNFKSMSDDLEGLRIENDKLVFDFVKPIPDFLEKVSFGFYGIAHPKDYDNNGKWINSKSAITSGAYKIGTWTNESIEIVLNEQLGAINNFKKITFHSSKELSKIRESDIVFFDKNNPYVDHEEWEYVSKTQNNSILYVQVMNWDDRNNFFHLRENRQRFRDDYYEALENVGYKVTRSFFPLEIHGTQELKSNPHTRSKKNLNFVRTQHFIYNDGFFKLGVIERGKYFKDAFELMANNNEFKAVYNDYPEAREDEKKVFDIQFLGTSILIDNPRDDIEFMFKSKHGIQLPDENGEITKSLNGNFNIQEINEKMWNQAIVWPIIHSSSGMWIKKSSNINTNSLNTSLHPLDAQFMYRE